MVNCAHGLQTLRATIHLRRPWTSSFFRPASRTIGFSPQFKTFGHVITFLRRCGLQNIDHMMTFWLFPWPLKVDCLSHLFPGTYTKHGPGSMYHPMDLVHGPSPWTTPWTTPNFQKEIAPVDMKIYQRSGYEKQILLTTLRVCLVIAGCFELKALE